jgi:hypothetical protein
MGFARWYRLSVGLLLVFVPLAVLFGQLDAIWNGHPAYPTTLLVTIALGMTIAAFALWPWRRDPEPDGPPWEADLDGGERIGVFTGPSRPPTRSGAGRRITGRILTGVVTAAWLGVLVWLQPFPAGPTALAAMTSDAVVTVTDHPTSIELTPVTPSEPSVGLVFSPGARVDARASVAVLRPLAESGYLVVILKEPFGLGITRTGQSAGPIADHPEIQTWAVGGHSLGGVSAAGFAADNLDTVSGLLLYASYPNDDLSGDVGLQVASIFGSNDLLTTPDDIARSMALLPPDTVFTDIDGGVHAFFADYGEQPGDGQPGVDRATATAEIAAASLALMDRLAAASP